MKTKIENPVLLVVNNGFYYFGDQVAAPEGYIALKNFAMFGGFSNDRGVAAVACARKGATVNLDRFPEDAVGHWPIESVCGILPCANLYEFAGTTLR